ncbi:hypothetical protein FNF07_14600 [Trinickia caryophylli]|nr:hypothetical protein C0Z17_04880 [Trinickia caryophylli]TRX20348.1 hypothetical protein FNF07_14600 [Trinickia caryophylli]
MVSATCSLCDRKSLLFYPVRYAIACPRGAAKAPGLTGNFIIDGRAPQSAGTAKMTLRALRAGYLYTYDEKRRRLRAYMVLENGLLWNFPPGARPPADEGAVNQLASGCASQGDLKFMSLGRCIDVEHTPGVDEATNLWIGWSNVMWTKGLVEKALDAKGGPLWRAQHMQCIDIKALMAGDAPHTGEFEASKKNVAHFSMDDRALKDAFEFSNTPTREESRQRNLADRIGQAMAQTPHRKGFVVAVNDPVGVANDLAELTVPNVNNGFDEQIYWKWMSAQLLERAEAGIRANAEGMTGLSYGLSKTINDVNAFNSQARVPVEPSGDIVGFFRTAWKAVQMGSLDKALKDEDEKISNIPAAQAKASDEAWQDASTKVGPDGIRVSIIDEAALKRFPHEYEQTLTAFKPKWQPLVQAHADWLKSELLAHWMAGNHDTKDLRSGYAYSESCAQAIGAAVGTDACKKVLDDWLNSKTADIRNMYARALMFNHDDLMKAADAQVHGSDIQYENFLNIYKGALQQLEKLGNSAKLRDRLVVTTANHIVNVLTKGARGTAIGYVTIRLSLHAGVRIKPAQVSKVALRNWLLDQGRSLGLELDGDRTEQRATATRVSKEVIKAAPPSDPNVLMYELDTDALVQSGKLDASEVKAIKVPGVDAAKRWLGSSQEFNLGIATAIFQMATLAFATKDLSSSDQFNKRENVMKFTACIASVIGNVVETAAETIAKAPNHPLSAFMTKQWTNAERYSKIGKYGGRALGSIAGLVLAGYDLLKNAPEAWANNDKGLARLYVASGILGAYVSVSAFFGAIPFFWPTLIASILVGIAIAMYKASQLKDWVSKCKFSNGDQYDSLTAELKAFQSAAGIN